jgi:monoterpene epsilon-lactone hydrolase
MDSPEGRKFAAFLESLVLRATWSDQRLGTVRDIFENLHLAGAEPEGVTYSEVDADGVEALWCIPEGADSEHALVHFHMGGAVVASMHSDRKAAAHIAKAAGVRSLVVNFRRAPENRYPAQVEDAEAAFDWLVGQGYRPADIGSVGHSVGGYLAVALALNLRDKGREMPGGVLSISPWCDLELKDDAMDANAESDKLLSRTTLEFFREAWLGGTGVDWTDPRINLLQADLGGLPPTTVYYGTAEILAGEDAAFGDRLARAGVDVEVHPLEGGQHSFIIAGGRVPEVDEAIADMGRWLRSTLRLSTVGEVSGSRGGSPTG